MNRGVLIIGSAEMSAINMLIFDVLIISTNDQSKLIQVLALGKLIFI